MEVDFLRGTWQGMDTFQAIARINNQAQLLLTTSLEKQLTEVAMREMKETVSGRKLSNERYSGAPKYLRARAPTL